MFSAVNPIRRYTGVPYDQGAMRISLGGIPLMDAGQPLDFDATAASAYLKDTTSTHGTVEIGVSIGAPGSVLRVLGQVCTSHILEQALSGKAALLHHCKPPNHESHLSACIGAYLACGCGGAPCFCCHLHRLSLMYCD